MADRETILGRVQKLLSKADSTTFDEERDALIAKADALMIRYAIEQSEIDEHSKEKREEIILHRVSFGTSPIQGQLVDLASAVATHVRCKMLVYGSGRTVGFVGFESDTAYAEMLVTHLWLQMSAGLEPKANPEMTDEENVITLLENGQSRRRVCELLGWNYQKDHGKVSRIYREFCEREGRPYAPRSRTHPTSYARNFAEGFVSEISWRLHQIRKVTTESGEPGTSIVLRDRSQEVKDKFDEMFPKLGTYRDRLHRQFDYAAQERGRDRGKEADLAQAKVPTRRRELG